ncbi:MAG: S9 family peptidase [Candidatus Eisenbacteria bacterium]|nr:S9 family peptidase [Candidatus Eisenbacteria bacterium]
MTRIPAILIALAFAAATPRVSASAPASGGTTARPATSPAAIPSASAYTLEHALTLEAISGLTWSRDGRHLAFVVTSIDTAETAQNHDLWFYDRDTRRALRLTRHPKNDFSPTFSPGGDTIAFVATRAAGDDAKPAIYMLSLEGGEPWAFGTYDDGVGEVAWSPDGRYLAYVMTDTLSKQIKDWRKKKWDQTIEDERLQYPHLWVIEVATGRKRRLTSGAQWIWNARWSPDSRAIAFLTSPSGKPDDENQTDLGIVSVDGGAMRRLGVIGNGTFAWSPDGRWIALSGGGDRKAFVQKADVRVVAAAGGAPVNLTAAFDDDAGAPMWSAHSDSLYFHYAHGVSTALAVVPRAGGAVRTVLDRGADAGPPVRAASGAVAWIQSDPLHPAEVVVADRVSDPGRPVTTIHAAVAALHLAATRAVEWTSSDGVRVEGLLVRPPDAPASAPLKTLVLLHGGPYGSRFTNAFQPVPQFYAAHGYQIFMPNFRSSDGYGVAFLLRQRADWGGQDWRDVTSGLDSLIARGLVDGKRLGVYGHSYGGYLSAWAITQTDRFRAAMVSAGAVDLAAHWAQSDIQQYRAWDFSGRPWESRANWERASPITYVARVKTPTIVFSGDQDVRVPFPQGQELYRSLLALGVPTEFVHYPREPHGYREYRHLWDRWTRTLAWFDKWIR